LSPFVGELVESRRRHGFPRREDKELGRQVRISQLCRVDEVVWSDRKVDMR
jgi:hypothetical protein